MQLLHCTHNDYEKYKKHIYKFKQLPNKEIIETVVLFKVPEIISFIRTAHFHFFLIIL